MDDSVKDPMEYTRRPCMLRNFDSDLDGDMWQSTGAHMVLAMLVAEQVGVRMMTLKSKRQKLFHNMDSGRG